MSNIDDAYPLTGVQQGMLFHSLQSSQRDDYLAHITIELQGSLDVKSFQNAWHSVLLRHPTLRSSFAWEGLDDPLQIVHSNTNPDWHIREELDASDSTRSNIITAMLSNEKNHRIDLTQAPLCRFHLLKWQKNEWTLIWSVHHLVSDGWSTPIVIDEVIKSYSANSLSPLPALPTVVPFKKYISHELSRDKAAAESYWRDYLVQASPCTLKLPLKNLTADQLSNTESGNDALVFSPQDSRKQHTFASENTMHIGDFCRSQRITLSTLINGSWALVLSHHSQSSNPTFGVVMSGRTVDVPGIESSVGLFVKTLPLSVTFPETESIENWLMSLQQKLHKHTLHDNIPPHTIQKLSGCKPQQPLFDTVVALQGHSEDAGYASDDKFLVLNNIDHYIQSHYPISLLVIPGDQLRMTIVFNPELVAPIWAQQLLNELVNTIEVLLSNAHSQLPDVVAQKLNENLAPIHLVDQKLSKKWQIKPQDLKYWRGVLHDCTPSPLLLPDHALQGGSTAQSYGSSGAIITSSATRLLKQRCQQLEISLATLVIATWSRVLRDLADRTQVLFGLTTTDSYVVNSLDISNNAGHRLDIVPIVIHCDDDLAQDSWLQSINRQVLAALEHNLVNLADIKSLLVGEDTGESDELFETVITFQEDPRNSLSKFSDSAMPASNIDTPIQNRFTLSLIITEGDETQLTLQHNQNKVSDPLAQRILARLEHYLLSQQQHGHRTTSLGDVYTVDVRPDHVQGYSSQIPNASLPDIARQQPPNHIIQWFNTSCDAHATKAALITTTGELTYAELQARVNRFSIALSKHVTPKSLIALHVDDKPSFIVAVFGTMMAGCTYLPLDPSYPASRKSSILESANADAIINDSEEVALSSAKCPILSFQSLTNVNEDDSNTPVRLDNLHDYPYSPKDVAYVLYTSGSSGTPKGVPITHNNLAYSTSQREIFYQEHPDRFLMQSSFSFDSSVVGLYWTLLYGGALVLPSNSQLKNIPDLLDIVEKHRITHTLSLPSIHQLLLEHSNAKNLSSLKTVIVAGESLNDVVVQQHFDNLPNTKLFNEYGPTECTVWCSSHQCSASTQGSVPIGHSLAQTPILVVDSNLNPCITGIVGEILIGGPGVAQGYINDRAEAQPAFVQTKFNDIENDHWYRSGDQGYISESGELLILGRLDTQIKLRGQRIELAEIDSAMEQYPGISRSITVLTPSTATYTAALLCFYERSSDVDKAIDSDAINEYLENILPSAYIPSQHIELAPLPTLPNGKVDRRKLTLRAIELKEHRSFSSVQITNDKIEKWVLNTLSNMLASSSITLGDNFFKLGGDSLNAMRLTAQIQAEFDVNIDITLLLDCKTLKDLGTLIRSASSIIESTQSVDETFESGEI